MKVIKVVRTKTETQSEKRINHRIIPGQEKVKGRTLKEKARFMRDNPSPAEKMLHQRLDELGIRYKSQIVLGHHIADVVLENKMVIMDLDTPSYRYSQSSDIANMKRAATMRGFGFQMIRIPSDQIYSFDLSVLNGIPNCNNIEVGHAIYNSREPVKTKKRPKKRMEKAGRPNATVCPACHRPLEVENSENLTEQFFFATEGI
jgi:very-short-patch-repair endonuclease